ncbi:hypothetical protein PAXRUDRAFT_153262 [Paxillus rubicundulus Ve08.2h10]|uniref:Uncharacterized protein n=1 Tax=Paxillus rubicundulus Ve08.2h10 TaxID=930991 RepID=A0A0D0D4T2_9AGAM|nr:hypothetical protein PAXRUDRAFT_153262 [Paxillus rubicundulus Ve08.2h10]
MTGFGSLITWKALPPQGDAILPPACRARRFAEWIAMVEISSKCDFPTLIEVTDRTPGGCNKYLS